MANETMTLISTITVGAGGAASINFNSIPQTYTDLFLVQSLRIVGGYGGGSVRFNSNSGSIYTVRRLTGDGSFNTSSQAFTNQTSFVAPSPTGGGETANTFNNATIYIPNYTGSTNKVVSFDGVIETDSNVVIMGISAGTWANTSAITSISLIPTFGGSDTYVQHSTASLYGILKGSGGATA